MESNFPWYNTLTPYKVLDYNGIEYNPCKDFKHISRYKGLRQVAHNPDSNISRFLSLETPNPFNSNITFQMYEVPEVYENRLDLVSQRFFGTPNYSWVISYFNGIEDGFTVNSGQLIRIPNNFSSLFNNGEILASIPATKLNLGTE